MASVIAICGGLVRPKAKMLKNHWFYCYFLIYGCENVKKTLVLLLFFDFGGGLARYMDIANKYNKTNGFF